MQGQVPLADRRSGRSQQPYSCNLGLVGQLQGQGAGIVSAAYGNCVYVGSNIPTRLDRPGPGVQVVDVSDPARPRHTGTLIEPPMQAGTWESLKVDPGRGLLAGTGVGLLTGIRRIPGLHAPAAPQSGDGNAAVAPAADHDARGRLLAGRPNILGCRHCRRPVVGYRRQ